MRVVPILSLLRLSQNDACLGVTGLITFVMEFRHSQMPFVLKNNLLGILIHFPINANANVDSVDR
jgi:hypothetical protein